MVHILKLTLVVIFIRINCSSLKFDFSIAFSLGVEFLKQINQLVLGQLLYYLKKNNNNNKNNKKIEIQWNLLITATQGTNQKWSLCTGDRYIEFPLCNYQALERSVFLHPKFTFSSRVVLKMSPIYK